MLTRLRGRPTAVWLPLPGVGLLVVSAGLAALGRATSVIGGIVGVALALATTRWTTRDGDDVTTRTLRGVQRVTLADPVVVIRPVRRVRDVTTVISVADGDGTRRVDVARFAPLTRGITLRRARRVARALGARFDEIGWRGWLARRQRPPARR